MAIDCPRIAILNPNDTTIGFLDNSVESTVHYYNDNLIRYVDTDAYTFEFSVPNNGNDTSLIQVGNRVAFRYNNEDYYSTIVSVASDENKITAKCWSLSLELTNEDASYLASETPQTIEWYINQTKTIDLPNSLLVIKHNEIGTDTKHALEFNEGGTILARLYDIAYEFDAELRFVVKLDYFYKLKEIGLYIYHMHDSTHQGMGKDRSGEIIRYGFNENGNIKGVSRTSDITEIYTSILAYGNEDITIKSLNGKKDGELQVLNEYLINESARNKFPSIIDGGDGYILKRATYDTDDVNVLYNLAKLDLLEHSKPKVTYEIDGYIDGDVGDTFTIEDDNFKPTLYVKARIVQQEIHFTDPTSNKTKFDNFTTVTSKISSETQKIVQQMLNEKAYYYGSIIASNGLFLKQNESTTLTALVMDGGKDVTNSLNIRWAKNNVDHITAKSVTVEESDIDSNETYGKIDGRDTYSFIATDSKGVQRAEAQCTVISIRDGKDAILLTIDSSNGNQFKNQSIGTVLTITIFVADIFIDNSTRMKQYFGSSAKIKWFVKNLGQEVYTELPQNDSRISDNGFILSVTTADVKDKAVFYCELDF